VWGKIETKVDEVGGPGNKRLKMKMGGQQKGDDNPASQIRKKKHDSWIHGSCSSPEQQSGSMKKGSKIQSSLRETKKDK